MSLIGLVGQHFPQGRTGEIAVAIGDACQHLAWPQFGASGETVRFDMAKAAEVVCLLLASVAGALACANCRATADDISKTLGMPGLRLNYAGRGPQFAQISPPGPVAGSPAAASSAQPRPEHWRKLEEGDAHLAAEDYEGAIAAYKVALTSRDDAVADRARRSLEKSLAEKSRTALGWKHLVPREMRVYGLDRLLLWVLTIAGLVLLVWWNYPIARRLFQRDKFRSAWSIKMVTEPAATLPTNLFLDEFLMASHEIKKFSSDFSGMKRIRAQGDVLDKFAFTPDIADMLPKQNFAGVDIGAAAKTLQKLAEHFSWRLEIRVGQTGTSPYAYASLHWGSRIESLWRIPNEGHEEPGCLRDAARALAYEIFSIGWVRP